MENLEAARLQMALTLIFHIVFACIGMVMPFFFGILALQWAQKKRGNLLKFT